MKSDGLTPSIEAVVALDPRMPKGLQDALSVHRRFWLALLARSDVPRVEAELRDPTVQAWVRARYVEDFGRLVAVVHNGGIHAAHAAERRRGVLTAERSETIASIHRWLETHGDRLDHLRVDFAVRGTEQQRRLYLQGLYATVEEFVGFHPIAMEDAYDAVHAVTRSYRDSARSGFAAAVRSARRARRSRGEPTPSWRAHGIRSFSLQRFRRSLIASLLSPIFPVDVPVEFQTGPQMSNDHVAELAEANARVHRWLGWRSRAPSKYAGFKCAPAPTAAVVLPDAVDAELQRLLPEPDRRALRAVVTVASAGIEYVALPASLGLGSGVAALRRVRKLQASTHWPAIARVLEKWAPDSLDRLARKRRAFTRLRRIG